MHVVHGNLMQMTSRCTLGISSAVHPGMAYPRPKARKFSLDVAKMSLKDVLPLLNCDGFPHRLSCNPCANSQALCLGVSDLVPDIVSLDSTCPGALHTASSFVASQGTSMVSYTK